jgi:hypothetical protein
MCVYPKTIEVNRRKAETILYEPTTAKVIRMRTQVMMVVRQTTLRRDWG